jgi:gamma-glutamyltranspeptidase/glutathione hydrolase
MNVRDITMENMKRLSNTLLILLLLCLSAQHLDARAPTTSGQAARAPVRAKHGIVVSAHPLASQAGVDVLKRGGNAVDAAVATGFALAVLHPAAGNIGGGGFMIVRMNDGTTTAIDFREKAPAAAHERMYLDEHGNVVSRSNHEGYLAVGVPGTVAGFDLAHKRFGTKKWIDLVAPAIKLAEDGFALSWELADEFAGLKNEFLRYPASAKVFLKRGEATYEPGETWKQPDLARTLRRIARNGRDGFYRGETARLLAADMKRNGGLITETDLASYDAIERAPVRGSYRGYEIVSMSPPSSGGTALIQMLNIVEGFDLKSYGHNSAQYLHLLTEAMRMAYLDRARYLGDPDFNPSMPVGRLLSKEYADELRGSISLNRAMASELSEFIDGHESTETTHYSVVDAAGNVVVVTYTIEAWYGSRIVADGLGFLLNNEMGDFNAVPGVTDTTGRIGTAPNLIAPGKRMLSSMTPTMILKDGKPWVLVGTPGGRAIISTMFQITVNLIDFEMNISEAISRGRIHHQWFPDVLVIEPYATTLDSQRLLEMMGHRARVGGVLGRAMGIMIDPVTGVRMGAADPRSPAGTAIGY